MPNKPSVKVQNAFHGGLKTEFTGLNFPEDACTAASNCVFGLIGDTVRRNGFDFESGFTTNIVNRTNSAISTFSWDNAGGDGQTKVLVCQVGGTLYFYQYTNATITSPLSTTLLPSTITLSNYAPKGASSPNSIECQYTSGNGYLFVFHPNLNSFYCTFTNGIISANIINMQIRDFVGLPDGLPVSSRPTSLSTEHSYNLQNQGWTNAPAWTGTESEATFQANQLPDYIINAGAGNLPLSETFILSSYVPVVNNNLAIGSSVQISCKDVGNMGFDQNNNILYCYGTVTNISLPNVTVLITSVSDSSVRREWKGSFTLSVTSVGFISSWNTQVGNYPSNADVWWNFKNTSNVFQPSTTVNNVTLNAGQAPQGYFILNPFYQDRGAAANLSNVQVVSTIQRPSTGTWFQGRVWYTGLNASQQALGDASFYTWTENIYFSQVVTNVTEFGNCFQVNDPTSQTLFSLLPTDGGVIVIQGSGAIYKLIHFQQGLLVFAANGIWYITGASGIGFTANNYVISKISNVRSISSTSFIQAESNILFWNEEGIYLVMPSKEGSLPLGSAHGQFTVEPITVGTILSFYNNIPLQSKKYARGSYNPFTYVVQWLYRSTNETGVTDRYQYDSALSLNVVNKAFYPYSISGTPFVHDLEYIQSPGGTTAPQSTFKYFTSYPTSSSYAFTFSEEKDNTNWVDWHSYDGIGTNYTSTFTTGYSIKGEAIRKFQPEYIQMYMRNVGSPSAYNIQGIWDFATDPTSGRYSVIQKAQNNKPKYGFFWRRHRIRGQGFAFQFKITSVSGQPFDFIGWSIWDNINEGP